MKAPALGNVTPCNGAPIKKLIEEEVSVKSDARSALAVEAENAVRRLPTVVGNEVSRWK